MSAAVDSSIVTYASYTCYNGSMFGYFIAFFGLSLGTSVWWGIKGLGYYDKQFVVLLLNLTWIPQHLVFFLLQNTLQEERLCSPRGNPGEVIYGNPSSETGFFFSFMAFVILFNYLRNGSMSKQYLYGLIGASIFLIWSLWWTGNFALYHLLSGAAVGSFLGCIIAVGIHYYWLEDFRTILSTEFMRNQGYYDTLCLKHSAQENLQSLKPVYKFFFIDDLSERDR